MEALFIAILQYIYKTEPGLPNEDAMKKAAFIFRFTTTERD